MEPGKGPNGTLLLTISQPPQIGVPMLRCVHDIGKQLTAKTWIMFSFGSERAGKRKNMYKWRSAKKWMYGGEKGRMLLVPS